MFEKKIIEEMIAGVKEVFSTMVMLDVEPEDFIVDKKLETSAKLSSMLGLGGDVSAMLAVHCTEKFAKNVTGLFLGMDVAEIDEDVKDAIGELANMIAGNIKIIYMAQGKTIQLAIPTTVVGESFTIRGFAGAATLGVTFNSKVGRFWVELKCKNN